MGNSAVEGGLRVCEFTDGWSQQCARPCFVFSGLRRPGSSGTSARPIPSALSIEFLINPLWPDARASLSGPQASPHEFRNPFYLPGRCLILSLSRRACKRARAKEGRGPFPVRPVLFSSAVSTGPGPAVIRSARAVVSLARRPLSPSRYRGCSIIIEPTPRYARCFPSTQLTQS